MREFGDPIDPIFNTMFEFKFANKNLWLKENVLSGQISKIDRKNIIRTLTLEWQEHCVECAVPGCYDTCVFYTARNDKACKRFVYGIYPNRAFNGRYNFGADIRFMKWAKIEANLKQSRVINTKSIFRQLVNFNFFYNFFKHSFKNNVIYPDTFDEFIIECYSENATDFSLIFEYFLNKNGFRTTKFKTNFLVKKGYNLFRIPIEDMKLNKLNGYIFLYPEETNTEKRIVLTWLDFVKYKSIPDFEIKNITSTESKVKCVAWDLDNTLWEGVLIEDKIVRLNPDSLSLIKSFDSRGIIQTIISKNDFEPCWQKLKELGLDKYFLFPEINWKPKSQNLKKIIEKLNLGVDSLAVIDDSHFERAEIKSQLPEVRVYSDDDIKNILEYSEFDVKTSNESKYRRKKYLIEGKRTESRKEFNGSYEDFLIDCEMEVKAFIPEEVNHISRCHELVQRSNQLNLTTVRYTKIEFAKLLKDDLVIPIALHCKDKYGDYGITGFSSIRMNKINPFLENFVISCRVAQKKVEHTFITWLGTALNERGFEKINVGLVVTAKNGPLIKVFKDFPFETVSESNLLKTLSLDLTKNFGQAEFMKFEVDVNVSKRFDLLSKTFTN